MEVIKATTMPTNNIASSMPVKANENLTNFKSEAPNITGIAKKKVNSAATVLDTPSKSAPTIVAPDLEVPGNIAAIS